MGNYFAKQKYIEHFNELDTLKTGDLILFSGDSFVSSLFEMATHSQWSHIGIIVRDPDFLLNKNRSKLDGLFVLQSSSDHYIDEDEKTRKFGVQICDLMTILKDYCGKIVVRKLITDKSQRDIHSTISTVYQTLYDKPYNWQAKDFMDALMANNHECFPWYDGDPRHTDKIFCSALVAYTYTMLGFLNKDTNWSTFYPVYFDKIDELTDGSKLSECIVIKDRV